MSIIEIALSAIVMILVLLLIQIMALTKRIDLFATVLVHNLGRDFEKSQCQRDEIIEKLDEIKSEFSHVEDVK